MKSVFRYIQENITDPKQRHEAYKMFKRAVTANTNDPKGYPVNHVLRYFVTGAYKRDLLPIKSEENTDE